MSTLIHCAPLGPPRGLSLKTAEMVAHAAFVRVAFSQLGHACPKKSLFKDAWIDSGFNRACLIPVVTWNIWRQNHPGWKPVQIQDNKGNIIEKRVPVAGGPDCSEFANTKIWIEPRGEATLEPHGVGIPEGALVWEHEKKGKAAPNHATPRDFVILGMALIRALRAELNYNLTDPNKPVFSLTVPNP